MIYVRYIYIYKTKEETMRCVVSDAYNPKHLTGQSGHPPQYSKFKIKPLVQKYFNLKI